VSGIDDHRQQATRFIDMRIYSVSHEGLDDTLIIARDTDHAAEIFLTEFYAARESYPGEFSVGAWKGRRSRQLDAILLSGICGILTLHPDDGWTVRPPDA
jgi:hypothetical protein